MLPFVFFIGLCENVYASDNNFPYFYGRTLPDNGFAISEPSMGKNVFELVTYSVNGDTQEAFHYKFYTDNDTFDIEYGYLDDGRLSFSMLYPCYVSYKVVSDEKPVNGGVSSGKGLTTTFGKPSKYYSSDTGYKIISSTCDVVVHNFLDKSSKNLGIIKNGDSGSSDDFNFSGDGLRIAFPEDGSKIAGYTSSQNGAIMDFKIYGKYKCSDSYQLDKIVQTGLQNSMVVRLGDRTGVAGEGVGIKKFEWVKSPEKGKECQFVITGYIPIWKKGSDLDFTVGMSYPISTGGYKYYADSIKIDVVQDMQDTFDKGYKPPDKSKGETSGNIDGGNTWNPKPDKPDSNNPIDWIKYAIGSVQSFVFNIFDSIRSSFESLVGLISSVSSSINDMSSSLFGIFNFLPSPIPELIKLCFGSICVISVIRFLRG